MLSLLPGLPIQLLCSLRLVSPTIACLWPLESVFVFCLQHINDSHTCNSTFKSHLSQLINCNRIHILSPFTKWQILSFMSNLRIKSWIGWKSHIVPLITLLHDMSHLTPSFLNYILRVELCRFIILIIWFIYLPHERILNNIRHNNTLLWFHTWSAYSYVLCVACWGYILSLFLCNL